MNIHSASSVKTSTVRMSSSPAISAENEPSASARGRFPGQSMFRRIAVALLALVGCRGIGDQPEPAARGVVVSPTAVAPAPTVPPEPVVVVAPPPKVVPALSVATSCTPPRLPSPSDVSTAWDVPYVEHVGRAQSLDVAWPKTPGPHPLVVLVHGGAWVGGDRMYHRDDMMRLAGAGYAAATIDYRLVGGPDRTLPSQLADVRCAVKYLRAHADAYAIDPARVGAIGDSAGGHLVAMLADADDFVDDGSCPLAGSSQIQAAVVDYAPLDLRAWRRYPESIQDAVHAVVGVEPRRNPALVAAASPITHVDANDPPMLVMHATHDHVIPVADSREFAAALKAADVPSIYVEVDDPRIQHGFLVLGNGGILRRTTCTTIAFLDATLR
jgi:acetyl esterase/lipase